MGSQDSQTGALSLVVCFELIFSLFVLTFFFFCFFFANFAFIQNIFGAAVAGGRQQIKVVAVVVAAAVAA